jgi:hypothetical protein
MVIGEHFVEQHTYFIEIEWFGVGAPDSNWFDVGAIDIVSRGGGRR